MADYIDREMAIDAIDETDWYHQNRNGEMIPGANSAEHQAWYKADDVYNALGNVPSVDAVEVVRCKDCKHWIPYDWMFSEVWKSQNIDNYAESEIGCTYCDMSMGAMDYCSRGERKDGDNEQTD